MKLATLLLLSALSGCASAQQSPVTAVHIGASFDTNSMNHGWDCRPEDLSLACDSAHSLETKTRALGYHLIALSNEGMPEIIWYNTSRPGSGVEGFRHQVLDLLRRKPDTPPDHFVLGLSFDLVTRPEETKTFFINVVDTVRTLYPTTKITFIEYPHYSRITNEEILQNNKELYWFNTQQLKLAMQLRGVYTVDIWYDMTPREDGFHPSEDSALIAAQRLTNFIRGL